MGGRLQVLQLGQAKPGTNQALDNGDHGQWLPTLPWGEVRKYLLADDGVQILLYVPVNHQVRYTRSHPADAALNVLRHETIDQGAEINRPFEKKNLARVGSAPASSR